MKKYAAKSINNAKTTAVLQKALLASGCLTALVPLQMVLAQSTPGSGSGLLEEIVVTAQKRQENAQDVAAIQTTTSMQTWIRKCARVSGEPA